MSFAISQTEKIHLISLVASSLVAGDIAGDHNNQRNCRYFKKVEGVSGILDADKAVADAGEIVARATASVDLERKESDA